MHSPSYLTPTASSPEIEVTSVSDNPNNNRDGGNDPNNNGDGDPNNNGGGANLNNNGDNPNNNNNNNNNNNGADNKTNVGDDHPAISPTKLSLKRLSVVVSLAALIWTVTLNPEMFVKPVGDEVGYCYCNPDQAVQVEDLVPPSMRNPSMETSHPESRRFDPGKKPNKKWLTRIIKDEECECRSKFFYIFMCFCNVSMMIIWWALLTMTFELPHVTLPVWSTLWVVWGIYCLSTRRLYAGETELWKLLQGFYTALLVVFVLLRLILPEKWKSSVRRVKKNTKSFKDWLTTKCGATEAEAMADLV